ncbi:hypothetical protein CDD83_5420 [Cordyceps sp. RAO-2017]|nr:hypothetical protein CDD83_5420 [Cordyceps sp. RAO-2017]
MKLFGALLGAATLVSPAYSNPNCRHPSTALADILVTEIRAHLGALQERARLYHDNRAFSTYGYEESVTYVLGVIGRFSAGRRLKTVVQSFDHLFEKSITKIKGPDDKDVMAMPLLYGNKTMGPGGIRRELAPTPIDDERGSCCFEDQWKGVNVRDKIALIKVGVCPMADKVQLATKNGARAVVLYNNVPVNISMGEVNKALGVDNWNKRVPAGLIGLEDGADWNQRLRSGEQLKVTLKVESEAKKKKSWNIITEVQEGDPEKIIMLGTHLDSSLNSPGINNGGSGTAALLSILRAVTRASCYKYRIRLAWWGAHEYGLAGSRHYASRLSKADAKKIKFYFNYDTIGSLDPHWTVLEDRGADKRGGTLLYDYLKAQGLDVTYK